MHSLDLDFRKSLIVAGWLPLPARGKAVTIPRWPTANIELTWIEQFDPALYPNVGLRCDHLIAFDLDCDDPKLVQLLLKCLPTRGTLGPLLRRRQESSRILAVYRLGNDFEAPPKYHRSAKFSDDLGQFHMFEVLAGSGHQFIGFGKKGSTEYYWDRDLHPGNTEIDAVCPLSQKEFAHALSELTKTLKLYCSQSGYEPIVTRREGGDFAQRFALAWGMEFTALGGSWDDAPTGTIKLEDAFNILEARSASDYIACHLDGIRPSSDSGAGRIRVDREGASDVIVCDFAHRTIWRLAEKQPVEESEINGSDFDAPSISLDDIDASRVRLRPDEWVFVANENAAYRIAHPTDPIPIQGFRNMFGAKTVKEWLEAPVSKAHCERCFFDPEGSPGRIRRGGRFLFNQYLPPDWRRYDGRGGSTSLFFDFLGRLVPDPAEHDMVLDWIALKVARPWLRMHGLIMVAEKQGTGRGTLVHRVLTRLLGEAYCNTVNLDMLLGRTYQSQYTDYLARALLIYVEEARDISGDRANDWNKRKQAYERLKEIVDPTDKDMMIVRKGAANTRERVYASLFISTNHGDALAIDEGDRRFIVVQNGLPLHSDPKFATWFHEWAKDDRNLAKLHGELVDMVNAKQVQLRPHGACPNDQHENQHG